MNFLLIMGEDVTYVAEKLFCENPVPRVPVTASRLSRPIVRWSIFQL